MMAINFFAMPPAYSRLVKGLIGVVAVAMSVYHLVIPLIGTPQAMFFRGTHLLFALSLIFLIWPGFRRRQLAWVFCRRRAWHSGFPQACWRSPTRGFGRNHRRQIMHGLFRASGMG